MPKLIASPLVVSAVQRRELERVARSGSRPEREVIAARGLVRAADGAGNLTIAKELGVSPARVRRWRERFAAGGLGEVVRVAAGRGPKRRIPDETVAEVVRVTREAGA